MTAIIEDGLTFTGWLTPPVVPPDPLGAGWRGPQGLQGPSGAVGPAGAPGDFTSPGPIGSTTPNTGAFNSVSTPLIANGGPGTTSSLNIGRPYTMSGAFAGPAWLNLGNTVTGTTFNQASILINVGSNSDKIVPNGGTGNVAVFQVTQRLDTGWQGGRLGLSAQLVDIAASSLGGNKVAVNGLALSNFNNGGVVTGFGTTAFGQGSNFGGVYGVGMGAGATFMGGQTGVEIDVHALAGSSMFAQIGLQIVHDGVHAVQGTGTDIAFRIADQVSAQAGWKNALITLGSYDSLWPLDANGYLLQVQNGTNYGAKPVVSAGGFDLNQLLVAGTGIEGGGFFWRSPGVKVKTTEVEVGYGTIANDANGLMIDATYQQMATAAGAITVANGGANFTSGDLVADAYGNAVKVIASAGVVTGISSVVTRGWQTSPPADPVAFVARTRTGAAYGTGLTLNLIGWTAKTGVTIAGAGSKLGFYAVTPVVRDAGWVAMTGTPDKGSTFDTATVTLAQLAGRVMSLQATTTAYGLLGP